MVHVKHSDLSESDWDSLSESGAQLQQTGQPINHNQNQETNPPVMATPLKDAGSDEPMYSEIQRPNWDQRGQRRPSSKGPLTFVDRNLPKEPTEAVNEERFTGVRVDHVDVQMAPNLQAASKKNAPIDAQSPIRSADTHSQSAPKVSAFRSHSSISFDGSNGFDNVAFEDSQKCSPTLPPPFFQAEPLRTGGKSDSPSKLAAVFTPADVPLPKPEETIEIFAFEKANTEFYQISEKRKEPEGDRIGRKLFAVTSRFGAEVAAILGLPFVFLTAVVLQLFRLATVGLIRPLILGLMTSLSDGFLKPLFTVGFNSLIQPAAVFMHNLGLALKLILNPLAQILDLILKPIAGLFQSFRLVQVHQTTTHVSNTPHEY